MLIIVYVIMLVVGLCIFVMSGWIANNKKRNINVYSIFQRINTKEKVDSDEKTYYTKKIRLVGLILMMSGLFGIGYININSHDNRMTDIRRPGFGEGTNNYEFVVKTDNNSSENISVVVDEKKFSDDELSQMCEKAFEKVLTIIKGNNESLSSIYTDLKLVDSIAGMDVNFDYILDDKGIISYDGKIAFDKILFTGGECTIPITIIESIGQFQQEHIVNCVIKEAANKGSSLQSSIQEEINKIPDTDEIIELPSYVENQKVSYYRDKSNKYYMFIPLALIASIAVYFVKDKDLEKKVRERNEQLSCDYGEIVSMISLLQNTGQSIRKSWERIISTYQKSGKNRFAYEEMILAKHKMDSGMPEIQAYREFGKRCGTQEYIKLSNILEQNIVKGTNSMKLQLDNEVVEASSKRMAAARKKAEECSTKMLIPMIIMMIIVMVILMVPAFMSMGI